VPRHVSGRAGHARCGLPSVHCFRLPVLIRELRIARNQVNSRFNFTRRRLRQDRSEQAAVYIVYVRILYVHSIVVSSILGQHLFLFCWCRLHSQDKSCFSAQPVWCKQPFSIYDYPQVTHHTTHIVGPLHFGFGPFIYRSWIGFGTAIGQILVRWATTRSYGTWWLVTAMWAMISAYKGPIWSIDRFLCGLTTTCASSMFHR
jgi:hypothetical protein